MARKSESTKSELKMNQPVITAESLANSLFQLFGRECHKNGIMIFGGKSNEVRADILKMARRVVRQSSAEGARA